MKKITYTLSGIKNIFYQQPNMVFGTSAIGVEFMGAACRTQGRGAGIEDPRGIVRGRRFGHIFIHKYEILNF